MLIGSTVVSQVVLGHIGGEDNRLPGQKIQSVDEGALVVVLRLVALGKIAVLQVGVEVLQGLQLTGEGFVSHGGTLGLGDAALQNFHIGENKLQIDGLDVAERVYAAVDVNDVGVLKAADHMNDGVALADICQELVAQTFALGSALDEAGDVDELDDRRGQLLGLEEVGQLGQTLIGNRHDAHVRVDGAEGVVGRFCACLGQRIKKGTFSHVGKPYDT